MTTNGKRKPQYAVGPQRGKGPATGGARSSNEVWKSQIADVLAHGVSVGAAAAAQSGVDGSPAVSFNRYNMRLLFWLTVPLSCVSSPTNVTCVEI